MAQADQTVSPARRDPVVALILGWLVPGAGHLYIGQKLKAVVLCLVINVAILAGLIMGRGRNIFVERYSFLGQVGGGVVALTAAVRARTAGINDVPYDHFVPYYDVGTLYSTVAGLLNMLLALDAMKRVIAANRRGPGGSAG